MALRMLNGLGKCKAPHPVCVPLQAAIAPSLSQSNDGDPYLYFWRLHLSLGGLHPSTVGCKNYWIPLTQKFKHKGSNNICAAPVPHPLAQPGTYKAW
jgi:hypothetical protein